MASAIDFRMERRDQAIYDWVIAETECRFQREEGWYVSDCLTRGVPVRRRCHRCVMLAKLGARLTCPENEHG